MSDFPPGLPRSRFHNLGLTTHRSIVLGRRCYYFRSTVEPVADVQGLALRTEYFHLDWTLRFTRPTVMIDGRAVECSWGESFFQLEPGPHRVQIFYRYLGMQAGRVSAGIDVADNQVISASYRAPNSVLIAFLPGKLCVHPPRSQQA
jgi:hypothetical protein